VARLLNVEDLLHGEMFALEQAGNLLHDAVSLFKSDRFASAVALAVICREELGRAHIYAEMRKQVRGSPGVSSKELLKRCTDHIDKLRRGQVEVSIHLPPQDRGLIDALADPEHPDHEKARKELDERFERERRRQPKTTHGRRMRGLYVEPRRDDLGWNRPCLFDRDEAVQVLEAIANDYDGYLHSLQFADIERRNALHLWPDCPKLPDPVWPPARLDA